MRTGMVVIMLFFSFVIVTGVILWFFVASFHKPQAEKSDLTVRFQIEDKSMDTLYVRNTDRNHAIALVFYAQGKKINFSGPSKLSAGQIGIYKIDTSVIEEVPSWAEIKAFMIPSSRDSIPSIEIFPGY